MERYYHQELDKIRNKLVYMGEKANEAGRRAVEGFLESDMDKTEAALKLDDEIDQLEVEIDQDSVRYITLRSPVSADVRLVVVAIKASHDLERVGDEAHGIAKRTRNILRREGRVANTVAIEAMSRLALKMMQDALTAFMEQDLKLARGIIERDREVDQLNKENFKVLSEQIPQSGDQLSSAIETILISRSLERIADHAKNLAEEVTFLLTGRL